MVKKLLLVILVVAVVALIRLNSPFQKGSPSQKPGVEFAYDFAELPITVTFKRAGLGDDDVTRIAAIPTLRTVVLADSRVTHRGLESLSALKGLQTLDLSRTSLDSDAMDAVARLSTLKELLLNGCSWLMDKHLASLSALKNLERLELSSPAITPAGLAQLSQLPALQELTIRECAAIDDEAVEHLASLTQLKKLALSDTELTSRGYAELCQRLPGVKVNVPVESLKDLRDVAQRGTFRFGITGIVGSFEQQTNRSDGTLKPLLPGDLTAVGRLTGLKSLHLEGEITDEMFLELGPLPKLELLFLAGTRITDEGMQRLAGFPSLKEFSMFSTPVQAYSYRGEGIPAQVVGSGLKHLKHTPGLKNLTIETQQSDGVLEYLLPLQNLEELVIRSPITDDDLSRMPVLAKLNRVWLNGTELRGPGIESLTKQPSLVGVTFRNGLVDDAAIEHIAKLTSLRYVSLRETRVTEPGKARLRNLCPSVSFD
jgi:Leucine-rich repeat (LRR) protein